MDLQGHMHKCLSHIGIDAQQKHRQADQFFPAPANPLVLPYLASRQEDVWPCTLGFKIHINGDTCMDTTPLRRDETIFSTLLNSVLQRTKKSRQRHITEPRWQQRLPSFGHQVVQSFNGCRDI